MYFLSTIVAKKDFGGAIQIQIPERNHAEHDLTTCDQTFCLAMSDHYWTGDDVILISFLRKEVHIL